MNGPKYVTAAGSLGDSLDVLELAAAIANVARARLRVLAPPALPLSAVNACAEACASAGVAVDVRRVDDGTPNAFIRTVTREPCDLLVKTASPSRGGIRGLRDLDRRLLHETSCTLLLARPPRVASFRRVAAAIRTSDPWREGADLEDRDVLDAAALLALAQQARLHVVHVWSSYEGNASLREYSLRAAGRARRAEREQARSEVREWLCRVGTPIHPKRVHAFPGLPEHVLARAPGRLCVDTLVIGGPRRPGSILSRLFSTADYVLPRAACSVMVVSRSVRSAEHRPRLAPVGGTEVLARGGASLGCSPKPY